MAAGSGQIALPRSHIFAGRLSVHHPRVRWQASHAPSHRIRYYALGADETA